MNNWDRIDNVVDILEKTTQVIERVENKKIKRNKIIAELTREELREAKRNI